MSNAFARKHGLDPKDNPLLNLQRIALQQTTTQPQQHAVSESASFAALCCIAAIYGCMSGCCECVYQFFKGVGFLQTLFDL
jgi:hypothetical protein